MKIKGKHQLVLNAIFSDPVQANIAWRDIENLFIGWGGFGRERFACSGLSEWSQGGVSPSPPSEGNGQRSSQIGAAFFE